MKKKINIGKKLSLNKDKLNQLNDEQLAHFLGGRMAATTAYTSGGDGVCSTVDTACCSQSKTACCG